MYKDLQMNENKPTQTELMCIELAQARINNAVAALEKINVPAAGLFSQS